MKKLLSACFFLALLSSCERNEDPCICPPPTPDLLFSVKVLNSEGKNQLHPQTDAHWQADDISAFAFDNNERLEAKTNIKSQYDEEKKESDFWFDVEIGEQLQTLYAEEGKHRLFLSYSNALTDTVSWDKSEEGFYLNGEPWTERDGATGALILKKEVL